MISRGTIIGKLVDDLSLLEYQINARNKLGQFDLTKVCEDFFREILNITFDYKLSNANTSRSNNPGVDLIDGSNKIAFQITSQKTSAKINETLSAITSDQLEKYSKIKVLIIGEKQEKYSLDEELTKIVNFDVSDIIDIPLLLKEIVSLDLDKLTILFNLFKTEFRTVKIELEPVDEEGNYESSYAKIAEQRPISPPKNAFKYLDKSEKNYEKDFRKILKLYERLTNVPRSTRELIFFIVDRGKYTEGRNSGFRINPKVLEKIYQISEEELLHELNILEEEGLVSLGEDFLDDRRVTYFDITNMELNKILKWMKDGNLPIRTILNTMNFTILDE